MLPLTESQEESQGTDTHRGVASQPSTSTGRPQVSPPRHPNSQPSTSRAYPYYKPTEVTPPPRRRMPLQAAYHLPHHRVPSRPEPPPGSRPPPRPLVFNIPVRRTRGDTPPRSPSPPLHPPPSFLLRPPFEPRGVFSTEGGEPVSRDYYYDDRNPDRTGLPSQPRKERKMTEVFEDNAQFFTNPFMTDSQGLTRNNAVPDLETDLDELFKDDYRPNPDMVWPPPSITESQEYKDSYVRTPIVTPNGSLQFEDDENGALAVKGLPTDPISPLGGAMESEAPTALGPGFEPGPTPLRPSVKRELSPLSPLSSLPSESDMKVDMPATPPRQRRRLSDPTNAMSSLSLIPDVDGEPSLDSQATPHTSPSHKYNLRRGSVAGSPSRTSPSPRHSPRRNLSRQAKASARITPPVSIPETTPQVERGTGMAMRAQCFADPLSAPTMFERGTHHPRKRSRIESEPPVEAAAAVEESQVSVYIDSQDTEPSQQRMTRSRSRKTRKIE